MVGTHRFLNTLEDEDIAAVSFTLLHMIQFHLYR